MTKKQKLFAILIILGGIFGTIAAFTLLTNRIEIYKNPDFVPPCSINPWLDCGRVMESKWANLFGFPNVIIGLITYPLAIMTGGLIFIQANLNKNFLRFCTILSGIGFILNNLFTYISSGIINTLCPWCLLSHTSTTFVFFGLLSILVSRGQLTDNEAKNQKYKMWLEKGYNVWLTIFYFGFVVLYVYLIFFLVQNRLIRDTLPDPIFWLYNS